MSVTQLSAVRDNAVTVFVLADDADGRTVLLHYRIAVEPGAHRSHAHFDRARRIAVMSGFVNPRPFDRSAPAGEYLSWLMQSHRLVADLAAMPDPDAPVVSDGPKLCTGAATDCVRGQLAELIRNARSVLGVSSAEQAEQARRAWLQQLR